jgi:uncharacterized LabA/DUF88 family protein
MDEEPTVITALYIDADNISQNVIESIISESKKLGRVSSRYMYGDFTKQEMCGWRHVASKHGIQQILTPSLSGKNSTDIKICIDIIDSVHKRSFIGAYIIATSDSDFIHIAFKLKEYGKKVYLLSDYVINKHIIPACDGYKIVGQITDSSSNTPITSDDDDDVEIDKIMKKIDKILSESPKPINLSKLNQDLINSLGFNYKDYGTSSMAKFVEKYCRGLYKCVIAEGGAYISKV